MSKTTKVYFLTRVYQGKQCLLLQTPDQLKHSTSRAMIELAISQAANLEKYGVLEVEVPLGLLGD